MSTRSQILVEGSGVLIYRHSDGYPFGQHGVLSNLKPFVDSFLAGRRDDPQYMAAHLIHSLIENRNKWARSFDVKMKRRGYPNSPTQSSYWRLGFGVSAWNERFQSDVEYIYIVKANGDIVVRRPMDGFWDNAYLSFTTVYRIVKASDKYVPRNRLGQFLKMPPKRSVTGRFLKAA